MYLIFDTETTGLPHNKTAPVSDLDNWPRLVQLAWQLHGTKGNLIASGNHVIKPEGFDIPFHAEKIHGINTKLALEIGKPMSWVLDLFMQDVKQAQVLVGHNIQFDNNIIGAEFLRAKKENIIEHIPNIDTSTQTTNYCNLPGGLGGGLKLPKLIELYEKLFGSGFNDAHDAAYDVDATAKSFFECLKRAIIPPMSDIDVKEIAYQSPDLASSNFSIKKKEVTKKSDRQGVKAQQIVGPFCHLHGHSQFSVLQAVPKVESILAKAKQDNMPAVAITDLGNMFGMFKFVKAAQNAGIKAIVGGEFYVAEERKKLHFTKDNPDKRFKQVLLAKTKKGYHNLLKLSTLAYKEGNYGLFPRIDKALITQYAEGLIALSGGLGGEIPRLLLHVGEKQAEDSLLWWKLLFGNDFYLEINRHHLEEEDRLNERLIHFGKKHDIKIIAANEYYYLSREDSKNHDALLCIKENQKRDTPIGRGRGFRFGFPNDQYYFKSQDEMKESFKDLPEAIENITEIINKVEDYALTRQILLPKFDIPEQFIDPLDAEDNGKRGENAYLSHLTYQGAIQRYGNISEEIKERIAFELSVIKKTEYPGYFLIVHDLISKAKAMDVLVGPGRGSASGSVVAYCIGITNVEPIRYNLLFERFLNPDRISMPDIDIDFDHEGRDKIIDYVIEKYGENQVAQIITYGYMAPKSAIRDAGRVMNLPLPETDALAKLVPERVDISFKDVLKEVKELKKIKEEDSLAAKVLHLAEGIEGSLRNIGVHPCGIIITPEDISQMVPLASAKDSDLLVTQYDNNHIETAGLLKMDFLGLKTLSLIRTTLHNIKEKYGKTIDIETIPLDDAKTYELYQRGETNATFQFESPEMQRNLIALKPNRIEDLIAMNALYRPGPKEYIPNFIARKHGKEAITYDIPEMEEVLAETYGITVYQEQVILLSQKLANFTKGEADILRKAMGKKDQKVLEKMKPKFMEQAKKNGHKDQKINKIWKDWEAFADYAFNKSHSVCYAILAYQTGYLKAHYPAEYMAAVLTHHQNDIDKISFFIDECKNRNIHVLGPDINESGINFIINEEGAIRFGLGAIKGTGAAAAMAIISERNANGPFVDIFDFATRINLRSVNKKSFDSLAKAGAFDCFSNFHRKQYIFPDVEGITLVEKVLRYANKIKNENASLQASLFGTDTLGATVAKPNVNSIEPFSELEKLQIEKEMIGFYVSGHPLEQFKFEMEHFTNIHLGNLGDLKALKHAPIKIGGQITDAKHRISKKGNPFGHFTIEDFHGNYTFNLFSNDYIKFKSMLEVGWFVFIVAVVQKSWKDEGLELKVTDLQVLGDLRERFINDIELIVSLEHIQSAIVQRLMTVVQKFPGKKNINIHITHKLDKKEMHLNMISRKFMVSPSDSLFDEIRKMEHITMKIHQKKNP